MYNIRRIEMAVNRVPVLKRCRSLGMDPIYLGINKKSNRQLKRANRKMSEYGLQLREKQKAKFIYGAVSYTHLNTVSAVSASANWLIKDRSRVLKKQAGKTKATIYCEIT